MPESEKRIDLKKALNFSIDYFGSVENFGKIEISVLARFLKWLNSNELEKKTIDFAIHSLKDLPSEGNNNLSSFTVTKREEPMDVLVLKKGLKYKKTHDIKLIGTSSIRRKEQIQKIYNGVEVKSIRGNVETRIKKLDDGKLEGIILAAAGLKRLGLEHRISKYFKSDEIIPAAGQGALAVEFRKNDKKTFSILKKIQDESTQICIN